MGSSYHLFWKRMAVLSAKRFCKKMLELSEDPYKYCQKEHFEENLNHDIDENNPVDRYIVNVIDLHKKGELKEHLDELERMCPFPDGLRGYLHEHTNGGADKEFQPYHLMYKLDQTRDEEKKITFEILIEYSLLEPEEDCYYGIKAISDNKRTTEEFVAYTTMLSSKWFELLSLKKSRKLENLKLHNSYFSKCYDKMKFTNNACDGTFWIGWVRVDMDDWSGIKKTVTTALNKAYIESFLNCLGGNIGKETSPVSEPKAVKQMKELTKWMQSKGYKNKWKIDGKTVTAERFAKVFIGRACSKPFTSEGKPLLSDMGNGVYQFNISNLHARYFIQTLFNPDLSMHVNKLYKNQKFDLNKDTKFKRLRKSQLKVQWAMLYDIFLRADGSCLPPNPGAEQFKYDQSKFRTPYLRNHLDTLINTEMQI